MVAAAAQESNSDQSRNRQEVTDGVSLLHGSVSCPFVRASAWVSHPFLSRGRLLLLLLPPRLLLRRLVGKKLRLEKSGVERRYK